MAASGRDFSKNGRGLVRHSRSAFTRDGKAGDAVVLVMMSRAAEGDVGGNKMVPGRRSCRNFGALDAVPLLNWRVIAGTIAVDDAMPPWRDVARREFGEAGSHGGGSERCDVESLRVNFVWGSTSVGRMEDICLGGGETSST